MISKTATTLWHKTVALVLVLAMAAVTLVLAAPAARAAEAPANTYVAATVGAGGVPSPTSSLSDDDCALLIQMTGSVATGIGQFEILDPATAAPTLTYGAGSQVQYVVLPGGCAGSIEVSSDYSPPPWNPSTGTGGVVFLGGTTLTLSANISADEAGFATNHTIGSNCDGGDGDRASDEAYFEGGGGGGGIIGGGGGAAGHVGPTDYSTNATLDSDPGRGGTASGGGIGGLHGGDARFDTGSDGTAFGQAPSGGNAGCVGMGGSIDPNPTGPGFWTTGAGAGGGGSYGGGGGGCSSLSSGAYSAGGGGGGSFTGGGPGGVGGTNTGNPALDPEENGLNGNNPVSSYIPDSAHYFNNDSPRVMMGGAGGASWANRSVAGPLDGGRGGGVIVLAFDTVNGNGNRITSNGGDGATPTHSNGGTFHGSSGSGGGAGGQIAVMAPLVQDVDVAAAGGIGGLAIEDNGSTLPHTGSHGASGGGGGIWFRYSGGDTSNSGPGAAATSGDAQLASPGLIDVSWSVDGGNPALKGYPLPRQIGGASYSADQWASIVGEANRLSAATFDWIAISLVNAAGGAFTLDELTAEFPGLVQPNNPKNLGLGCGPGLGGTGLVVAGELTTPIITIETLTNSVDSDEATGEELVVGETVTWTYEVTVRGAGSVDSIVVTDANLGVIDCPSTTLNAGETMTCTATGVVTEGEYATVGTVDGTGTDSDGATVGPMTSDDPTHHVGLTPGITLEKTTNGQQADTGAAGNNISVGSPVTWEFVVTNSGATPLINVAVADTTDLANDQPGAENLTCDWGASSDTLTPAGTLSPGESVTCSATGVAGTGEHENTGSVTAQPARADEDGVLIGATDGDDAALVVAANDPSGYVGIPTYDLALATVLNDATVTLTETLLDFDVVVQNQGQVPSGSFTVTNEIPAGTEFVSASDGATESGGIVTWTIPAGEEIASGETVTLDLVVRVTDLNAAPFTNTAEISADSASATTAGTDDDSTPDTTLTGEGADNLVDILDPAELAVDTNTNTPDEDDHDVAVWAPTYDLALANVLSDVDLSGDQEQLTFEVTVQNQGDLVSGSFAVTDEIPAGTSFVSATNDGTESAGVVTWTVDAVDGLLPDETTIFEVVVAVDDPSSAPFTNTAEISADSGTDDDSTPDTTLTGEGADNLVDILDPAELAVDTNTNTPDEDDHDVAVWAPTYDLTLANVLSDVDLSGDQEQLTFEVTVRNQGELMSSAFTVTDEIPAGTSFVSATNDGTESAGVVTWTVDAVDGLLPDETTTFEVVVAVDDPSSAPFTNTAEISADSGTDDDSTPDTTLTGEGADNLVDIFDPAELAVDTNTNTPDEDDHDIAVYGPEYDLALANTLNNISADGTQITFDVTVRNQGELFSGAFTVTNEIPAGTEFVSATNAGTESAGTVTWVVPADAELRPDETTTLSVTVAIVDVAQAPFINTAEVSAAAGVDDDSTPDTTLTGDGADNLVDITDVADLGTDTDTNVPDEDDHDIVVVEVPTYRLGNLVWLDTDDDGIAEDGEPGIANVEVELWQAEGTEAYRSTTTDTNGKYSFDELAAGDYFIVVPADQQNQTISGQPYDLSDLLGSSVVTADPDAAGDVDNDNNGFRSGVDSGDHVTGIVSIGDPSQFAPAEPTDEVERATGAGASVDDDDDATPDAQSNYTVDIGLVEALRVGNLVWLDDGGGFGNPGYVQANEDNGIADAGELGIEGVTVHLLDEVGAFITDTITDSAGVYVFDGLRDGTYQIAIPDGQEVLAGLRASTPRVADAEAADDDNNGAADTTYASISEVFDLNPGTEADDELGDLSATTSGAAEANVNATRPFVSDVNSNLEVDFGFSGTPLYRLGNLVWEDYNDNGIAETNEPGIAGVLVQLIDANDEVIGEQITDANGLYAFEDLVAGDYTVRIPIAQASDLPGADPSALQELDPSSVLVVDPDAAGDLDNDSNGNSNATSIESGVVTLGEADNHSEIEGETVRSDDPSLTEDASIRDDRSNLAVDFGFFRGLRLGNQVFLDGVQGDANHNNGVFDEGERGLVGAIVELWIDADESGDFDPDSDTFVADTTTDLDGNYWFGDLDAGVPYMVAIESLPADSDGDLSSTPTASDPTADDNGDDGAPTAGYISVTAPIQLALGGASTGETDTLPVGDGPAEAEANAAGDFYLDENSELTVDLGFIDVPIYRLGNLVWEDLNNNGLAEESEPGLAGVLVQLINDAGEVFAETATDAEGHYVFDNLIAGTYSVRIPTDQIAVGATPSGFIAGALDGYQSSTNGEEADPDADLDNNDNGIGLTDWQSGAVTLGETLSPSPDGDEPRTEQVRSDVATDDDPDAGEPGSFPDDLSNLSVDFGFYQLSLGDQVWLDANDNGVVDDGESGIADVAVQLFDAVDMTTPVAETITDDSGNYLFGQLVPGTDYIVRVPASNFQDDGPLAGLVSSTDGPTAGLDPDGDESVVGDGIDSDDNGVDPSTPAGDVDSQPVTLFIGDEPADEPSSLGALHPDANQNLTVDFGFHRGLRLGSLVWLDDGNTDPATDENGVADSNEDPIADVPVELWLDSNDDDVLDTAEDSLVTSALTGADGLVDFAPVAPGTYFVVVPDSYLDITGYASTFDGLDDDATNNDDNGVVVDDIGLVSAPIEMEFGSAPVDEINDLTGLSEEDGDYADANSNYSVDFGLVEAPLFRIGNLVFDDVDGDGIAEVGEDGIANVLVQLLNEDGDVVAETLTDGEGTYEFDTLQAGTYSVRIPADQTPVVDDSLSPDPAALDGFRSSEVESSSPNDDVDNDDNGLGTEDVTSGPVTLGGTIDGEPTDETVRADDPTDADDAPLITPDYRSNFSVDFAFSKLALGDEVWLDENDNGVRDDGEPGIADVVVELYLADDLTTPVDTTVTSAEGNYVFERLTPGAEYVVRVPASNFAASGPLADLVSSTDGPVAGLDPDGDESIIGDGIDRDDNGVDPSAPAGDVDSQPVTLFPGDEPLGEPESIGTAHPDANQNLTVDFGFHRGLRLAASTWLDDGNADAATDENGLADSNESPIGAVPVQLWLDSDETGDLDAATDTLVTERTTSSEGLAEFAPLPPGTYFVVIPDEALEEGGVLEDHASTFDGSDDDTTNNDDNGVIVDGVGLVSAPVVLDYGQQPTGEVDGLTGTPDEDGVFADSNSNYTVDFGFIDEPLFSIGNLVFADLDGDGIAEADESGIAGVLVQLLDEAGDVLAETVTDDAGSYEFDELPAGDYQVRLPTDQTPVVDTTLEPVPGVLDNVRSSESESDDPNDDVDNDDNGIGQEDITSGPVVLGEDGISGEPVDETVRSDDSTTSHDDASPTPDYRTNQSVDFGLYRLSIGNQVFFDWDNSGALDALGESGIPGVQLDLRTEDGDFVDSTETDEDGRYLFEGLTDDATYVVEVAPGNFGSTGPLAGYHPSTGARVGSDPDDDPTDDDSNGFADGTAVIADPVTVSLGAEPTDEPGADNDELTPDSGENRTVDFGFYTNTIGDRVWLDTNDDGIRDADESGIASVEVNLIDDATGEVIATELTDDAGAFLFTGLPDGSYNVVIDDENFVEDGPLAGLSSSTPTSDDPSEADDVDDGSNSSAPESGPVPVVAGAAPVPTDSSTALDSVPLTNQTLTIDFGFHGMELGNLVFADLDSDGVYDSATEAGLSDVTVELYSTTENGELISDDPIASIVTDPDGRFLFTGLEPGTFRTAIPAAMLEPGGPLWGYESTIGNGTDAPDPDTVETDNDDNGDPESDGSTWSDPITLAPGTEPTGEDLLGTTATPVDDTNSNLTLDLGFEPRTGLAIGNRIWSDTDGDGQVDADESGVEGVRVELLDSDGTLLTFATTDESGYYLFPGLPADSYMVQVPASNFDEPTDALWGTHPTASTDPDINADVDNDHDGPSTAVSHGDVVTPLITLRDLLEPVGETDVAPTGNIPSDPNDNLTVDLGFVEVSLGGSLFGDPVELGIQTESSPALAGVTVVLLDGEGAPVLDGAGQPITTVTDNNGDYLFDGLAPGSYQVQVPAEMFAAGAPLENFGSSRGTNDPDTGVAPDPDGDADGIDDGDPVGGDVFSGAAVQTRVVTLSPATEPTEEPGETDLADDNANLTVDLGFFEIPPYELGGRIFIDENNDGRFVGDESPAPSDVEVALLDESGAPVMTDGEVAMTTTDDDGQYSFTDLPAGTYYVQVVGESFDLDGSLNGYWPSSGDGISEDSNDDVGDVSDGQLHDDCGCLQSTAVQLSPEAEPTTDRAPLSTIDSHSNLTVDFGIYSIEFSNSLWVDSDRDGDFDETEQALADVTLLLLDEAGEPVLLTHGEPATATTDEQGSYQFTGLPAGTFRIAIPSENFDADGPLANIDFVGTGGFAPSLNAEQMLVSDPFVLVADETEQGPAKSVVLLASNTDSGVPKGPVASSPSTYSPLGPLANNNSSATDNDSPTGPLALTGANSATLVRLGVLLMMFGSLFLGVGRVRKQNRID